MRWIFMFLLMINISYQRKGIVKNHVVSRLPQDYIIAFDERSVFPIHPRLY